MIAVYSIVAAAALSSGVGVEVARVNDASITAPALLRRVEIVRAQGIVAPPERVLDGLVNEALLADEGKRLGLASDPLLASQIERERRRALGDVFLESEVAARYEPDEQQLRSSFHATADFAWYEYLAFETETAASDALQRIRTGTPLSAEAERAVTARTYPDQSRAPPTMRAQLAPALAEALFSAKPGDVVGPIRGDAGFLVCRLLKKEIGDDASYAARRASLAANARKQVGKQMGAHVATQLRARSGAHVDETFLRETRWIDGTPSQLEHVVAKAGTHEIRFRELQRLAQALSASSGHAAGAELTVRLAWQEVDAWLLADAASARGQDKDPVARARMDEAARAVLGAATLDAIRRAAPPPTEREIEEFYRRNAARFRRSFEQALPEVAAGAAAEKRERHAAARIADLRRNATITVDAKSLARVSDSTR